MKKYEQIFYITLVTLFSVFGSNINAQERPIQISLFTPVQIFPASYSITGIRLNLIYGRNASVSGLDIGLVNQTTAGISKGVQWGVVSINDNQFMGWQNNFVNITKEKCEGFQWGLVNYAGTMSGFQLGLVNFAGTMNKGLQIGLVNIINHGGQFPVFPIVNWAF